jgi:hypothetical protein
LETGRSIETSLLNIYTVINSRLRPAMPRRFFSTANAKKSERYLDSRPGRFTATLNIQSSTWDTLERSSDRKGTSMRKPPKLSRRRRPAPRRKKSILKRAASTLPLLLLLLPSHLHYEYAEERGPTTMRRAALLDIQQTQGDPGPPARTKPLDHPPRPHRPAKRAAPLAHSLPTCHPIVPRRRR